MDVVKYACLILHPAVEPFCQHPRTLWWPALCPRPVPRGRGSPKVRGKALQPLHYRCFVASPRDLFTFRASMLHPLAFLITGQGLLGL